MTQGRRLTPPPALNRAAKNERSSAVAAVDGLRAGGLAVVPVRREGADHRVGVAGAKRGAEAADDISRQVRRRAEDGGPGVLAAPVDLPLAAVGAEYHRTVVAGFGDDGHRPELFLPVPV